MFGQYEPAGQGVHAYADNKNGRLQFPLKRYLSKPDSSKVDTSLRQS